MKNSVSTQCRTTQKLELSTGLIFSLKILSLNICDLFHFVAEETLSNPALEFVNQEYLKKRLAFNEDYSHDTENIAELFLDGISEQIEHLPCDRLKKKFLFDVLNHFLDENFFLKKNEFFKKYSSNKYHEWLRYFKRIKPVGIAALHLQERIKHQLEYYGLKNTLSYQIIDECWHHFLSQNNEKIQILLKKGGSDIQKSVIQIKKYCKINIFKTNTSEKQNIFTYADIILTDNNILKLNDKYTPTIQINKKFSQLMRSTLDQNTISYVRDKICRVKNIIKAIEKRNQTLILIAKMILDFHSKRITNPTIHQKLHLKTIASTVKLSQSTISRTLKNKTIQTSEGIKLISDFLKPLTLFQNQRKIKEEDLT